MRQKSDSGVWQKISAAETTQTSVLNQFPPTQQKMPTPSVPVTHSSCSANCCSPHPSENRTKLLRKLFYAIASWNTREAAVYGSTSADASVLQKPSSCIMDVPQQISVLGGFVYVLDRVWGEIDPVAAVASAAAVSPLKRVVLSSDNKFSHNGQSNVLVLILL